MRDDMLTNFEIGGNVLLGLDGTKLPGPCYPDLIKDSRMSSDTSDIFGTRAPYLSNVHYLDDFRAPNPYTDKEALQERP